MNLLHSRERWAEQFTAGVRPKLVKKYELNRTSEHWRSSSVVEELCEYILFLENAEYKQLTEVPIMPTKELWVDTHDINYVLRTYDMREHKDTIEHLLKDICVLKQEVEVLLKTIEEHKIMSKTEDVGEQLSRLQKEEVGESSDPVLIINSLQTPDGTILKSTHRHDYNTYTDANGKTYMVDGGLDYVRRSNNGDEIDLCLYDDEDHEVQRQVLKWGTYGINGDQPLTYLCIADMDTSHIAAVTTTIRNVLPAIMRCMKTELVYRRYKG